MEAKETGRRVLARAAIMLGGAERLATRLQLTRRELGDYLTGAVPVPDALFLEAIDILLEELPDPKVPAPARPELRHTPET